MQKKCNIVIRRSKTPRLLISNMNVHVHICNIYSAYICVYNAIFGGYRPVYNQYVIIVGYRGKIPDGDSNPIYLLSPETPKSPKFLTHFRPSRVFHVLQICRICM